MLCWWGLYYFIVCNISNNKLRWMRHACIDLTLEKFTRHISSSWCKKLEKNDETIEISKNNFKKVKLNMGGNNRNIEI